MSFTERLNKAMKLRGFTQAKLADAAKMAQSSVWKLTSGKARATRKLIEISNALNVNPTWLSQGIGNMDQIRQYEKDGSPMGEQRDVDEWDDSNPLEDDEVEVPYYKSIELAAGHGCNVNEDYNGYKLRFGKSFFRRRGVQKEFAACFPASGNSMTPFIPNGSVVAVDTANKKIIDGDIYAICQDGLCRIKRLFSLPNHQLRITSYNAVDHPDETANLKDVQIIGRVFYYSVEL